MKIKKKIDQKLDTICIHDVLFNEVLTKNILFSKKSWFLEIILQRPGLQKLSDRNQLQKYLRNCENENFVILKISVN